MKNTISHSVEVQETCSAEKAFFKMNRIHLFALLSSLGLLVVMPQQADAETLIPYCKDMSGYSKPSGNVWLEGDEEAQVVCIVDGDTFDVRLKKGGQIVRIRLWGVDCPESSYNKKCQKTGCDPAEGKKISEQVRTSLTRNKEITLEPPYRNNGERKMAYVRFKNGVDFGRALVDLCLCRAGYQHARKRDYKETDKKCR